MLDVNYVREQAFFKQCFVCVRKLAIAGNLVWIKIYSIKLVVVSLLRGRMIHSL